MANRTAIRVPKAQSRGSPSGCRDSFLLTGVVITLTATFVPLTQAQDPPADIIHRATRAVEMDSVESLRRRWSARAARDPNDLAARFGLATLARLTYDYARADSLYDTLLDQKGEEGERFGVWARLGQGIGLQSQGHFVRAHAAYEGVVAEAAGRDSTALARALIRLAGMRARTQGPAAALEVLDEAAAWIPSLDLTSRAAYRCQRAGLVRSPGDAWAGLDEGEKGAELAQRARDARTRAGCLHALARIHLRNGDIDGAADLLTEAGALQQRAKDRAGRAATLQWGGYLQQLLTKYGHAHRLLHESIQEAEASGNLSPAAWAYLSLSGIALRSGDRPRAQAFGERAADIFRVRRDPQGELAARLAVAAALVAARQAEEARTIYLAVLPELERLGAYDWHTLNALIGLMETAMSERDWDDALGWLERARDHARARGMTGWASGLDNHYAQVALARGDLETAQRHIESSLARPEQGSTRYLRLVQRAELRLRRGDLKGAEADLERAADELDGWRETLDLKGLRRHAFQLTGWDHDPDLKVATIVSAMAMNGRPEAAFRAAERRRARSLLDQLVRADALASDGEGRELELLRRPPARVEAAEITSALPDEGVALLEYVTGVNDEPTTLFVVTRRGLRAYRLPPIDSLAPRIQRFRGTITSGVTSESLARQLAIDLLVPALNELQLDLNHLLVVADGALHGLPFDLLRLPSGDLVVESFLVTLVPSASVARELWARPARTGPTRILVLADPRFDSAMLGPLAGAKAGPQDAFAEGGSLTPLPGSRKEARLVSRYAEDSQIRLSSEASEAFVKEAALDEYSVLHFATHARVDSRTISRTALALASGGGEDGFLEPGEIATLTLNADLVVLSACRTAAGMVIQGEGVYGLTAPLLETGARAVLATSWPVEDRAAAGFVRSFYGELAAGRTLGEALHAAKLGAIRSGSRDRDWAAYTLVGDPFVHIPLHQPRDNRLPALLVVSSLVALAGGLWLSRRVARPGRSRRQAAKRQA